jgi:hypothetical protein
MLVSPAQNKQAFVFHLLSLQVLILFGFPVLLLRQESFMFLD